MVMLRATFLMLQLCLSVQESTPDCTDEQCFAPAMEDDTASMIQGKVHLDGRLSQIDAILKDWTYSGRSSYDATENILNSLQSAAEKAVRAKGVGLDSSIFESIKGEIETMTSELVEEQDGFQKQVNDSAAAVETCNKNKQTTESGDVAAASEIMTQARDTHHTCREDESSAYNAYNASCVRLSLKTESIAEAAPSCNGDMNAGSTTASVLTCLRDNRRWVAWHEYNLTTQQTDCNNKTTTWNNKADECDINQTNYEEAVCSYAQQLASMCSELDTCHGDAVAAHESAEKLVEVEEEHLKTVLASAKKIICFLSVLASAATQNLTMADLTECKQLETTTDKTYLNVSVADLTITYPTVVAKEACDVLSTTPGEDQWAQDEYGEYEQTWLREPTTC